MPRSAASLCAFSAASSAGNSKPLSRLGATSAGETGPMRAVSISATTRPRTIDEQGDVALTCLDQPPVHHDLCHQPAPLETSEQMRKVAQ